MIYSYDRVCRGGRGSNRCYLAALQPFLSFPFPGCAHPPPPRYSNAAFLSRRRRAAKAWARSGITEAARGPERTRAGYALPDAQNVACRTSLLSRTCSVPRPGVDERCKVCQGLLEQVLEDFTLTRAREEAEGAAAQARSGRQGKARRGSSPALACVRLTGVALRSLQCLCKSWYPLPAARSSAVQPSSPSIFGLAPFLMRSSTADIALISRPMERGGTSVVTLVNWSPTFQQHIQNRK